jgi:hypothetical protein
MAQCEKCGTTFEPSANRTEVTSLRILCAKCEAERRAEKAARAQAAAAAQATPRSPAPQPAPAPRPTATARPAAPAPRPAEAHAEAGGTNHPEGGSAASSRRAQSSAPGSSRRGLAGKKAAVGTGVRGAQAKALHGEPSKKLFHKPAKKAKDTEHSSENFHPDVQRELRFLQQREGKVMKIAWIVCAVLLVAAGGFAFAAKAKRDAISAAAEDHRNKLDQFLLEMQKFDVKTEAGAKAAIDHAEKSTALGWEDDAQVGGAVGGILTGARMSLQKIEDVKEQTDRLVSVETALRDAASQPAEALLKARRTISSLEEKGEGYGADFATRVKAARATIDQTILKRLSEEAASLAKTAGESPEKMRAALNAYTKAEDEATTILDKVMRMKDEDTKQYYTKEFRRIVDESNAFVTSVFTPEVIERTPWTDLLAADQLPNWQNYGLAGFRLASGTLEVAGPAAGSTQNGLIAVPAAGGYRDFVIDMDFVLNKGVIDWLFRLGRRVDNTVESYGPLGTTGEVALKPGVSYHMAAKYIGGNLNVVLTPADVADLTIDSGWTKMRKGAFGAQIHEGVELKITRLKIRLLRGA